MTVRVAGKKISRPVKPSCLSPPEGRCAASHLELFGKLAKKRNSEAIFNKSFLFKYNNIL
jgi:hypothetical protein